MAFRHTVKLSCVSLVVETLFTRLLLLRLCPLADLAVMCPALLLEATFATAKWKLFLCFSYPMSVWHINLNHRVKVCFVLIMSTDNCSDWAEAGFGPSRKRWFWRSGGRRRQLNGILKQTCIISSKVSIQTITPCLTVVSNRCLVKILCNGTTASRLQQLRVQGLPKLEAVLFVQQSSTDFSSVILLLFQPTWILEVHSIQHWVRFRNLSMSAFFTFFLGRDTNSHLYSRTPLLTVWTYVIYPLS